jgi:hypothetical protein
MKIAKEYRVSTTRELFIKIQKFLDGLGSGKPFSVAYAKELSAEISVLTGMVAENIRHKHQENE